MVLQLDPPELGSVNVRLIARGDDIQLTMHSVHGDARTALGDQRASIQDAFAAAGLELRDFDITGGDPEGRGHDDGRQPGRGRPVDVPFDDAETLQGDGALRL